MFTIFIGGRKLKTQIKGISMPLDLIKEIEKYMKENYITTFTAAVIELVRRGLEASK